MGQGMGGGKRRLAPRVGMVVLRSGEGVPPLPLLGEGDGLGEGIGEGVESLSVM